MKKRKLLFNVFVLFFFMSLHQQMNAQNMPEFFELPSLPNTEGMAGMFAGKSNGRLFCMGGANFPDKKPWEGGKKIWYDVIFMLDEKSGWSRLEQKLPTPLAYGIAVDYKDEIIIVGGNDDKDFHSAVFGLHWDGHSLKQRNLPPLPKVLANMAGTLVGNLIIVAGGTSSFQGLPLSDCYALDLEDLGSGWVVMPTWPGPARTQPVSGSYGGNFFLFSGEMAGVDMSGNPRRYMLQDAYRFKPEKSLGKWTGTWEILPVMPKAVSASANPVPVLDNGDFVFWGGVDATAAVHKDPVTHPGIDKKVFLYGADTQVWSFAGIAEKYQARVTLPTVLWKGNWLYISGEIKPGIRINSIVGIKNK